MPRHLTRSTVYALLALGVASVVGILMLRGYLEREVREYSRAGLTKEDAMVELSIQHALLQNNFPMVSEILGNAAVQSELQSIRLINSRGIILASSIPGEIGVQLDTEDPLCHGCHLNRSATLPDVLQLPGESGEADRIITANRLDNAVACHECHQPPSEILGLLLTERGTSAADAWLSRMNLELSAGGLLIGLTIILTMTLGVSRGVYLPLYRLAKGDRLEEMTSRDDVIGVVAHRLDEAVAKSSEMERDMSFQRRGFGALLSLLESLDASTTVGDVLNRALKVVRTATGYSTVAVRLYDDERKGFHLVAQAGMSAEMVNELEWIPEKEGFPAEAKRTKHPVSTSNLPADPRLAGESPLGEGYKSLVCVPLLGADQVIGTMELALKDTHEWKDDELRWLALVGRSVGIVVHYIRQSEKLKSLTAVEERNRVAQEIHDGLAQLLGSLSLWAEEASLSVEGHDYGRLRETIQKIENTARDASVSLREEMLGLREDISGGEDLLPAFTRYLDRFQRLWGIRASVELYRGAHNGSDPGLSRDTVIQLLRILQEGLTNVRRHAAAQAVRVRLDDNPDDYRVVISDDGNGFDPEAVTGERLGIRIMKERAAAVGGGVEIRSVLGQGTTIEIVLPKNYAS